MTKIDPVLLPRRRVNLVFVVSAFNEESVIGRTLDKLLDIDPGRQSDYFVLVADDGSTDNTLKVVHEYSQKYPERVGYVHTEKNHGIGVAFTNAYAKLDAKYVSCVPGDDMLVKECFETILRAAETDVPIISFLANQKERSIRRRIISKIYSGFWSKTLNLKIKYINGTCTYELDLLKRIQPVSNSFNLFPEITAKTIILGARYKSVPFYIEQTDNNLSKNQMLSLFELPRAYLSCLKMKFWPGG